MDTRPIGSRLVLFPDWGVQVARPGALAAMSLHLAVKTAANGHVIDDGDVNAIDRYDTRFLLDARLQTAGHNNPTKNLWMGDAGPEADRGIRFEELRLG